MPDSSREISKADLQRFFAGKHITGCPVCGHYGWRLVDGAAAGREPGARPPDAAGEVEVLTVICQNCGFVGTHDRTVVAQWLHCHRAHAVPGR